MPQEHLVVADTVESALKITSNGRSLRVVIHHIIPAGTSVNVALADSLFTSLRALWATNLQAQCPSTTSFSGIDMRDLRQQGQPLVSSTGASQSGTGAGDALPNSVAACLTVRTNRAGRQYRGRMYWGGFAELANGPSGTIIAATKTALDAFAANFIGAANVSGMVFGVMHRPTAFDPITGLPISPGLGFTTPATSVVVRDVLWDSQRRRVQ